MRKILFLILPIFLLAQIKCSKCQINKIQIKCDYYVAKLYDINKKEFCFDYANYLTDSKVFDKASWYYLISLNPKKAIFSAKKALEVKEFYVYEYLFEANLLLGNYKSAKKFYKKYVKLLNNNNFFLNKHIKILSQLYKKDLKKIMDEEF